MNVNRVQDWNQVSKVLWDTDTEEREQHASNGDAARSLCERLVSNPQVEVVYLCDHRGVCMGVLTH